MLLLAFAQSLLAKASKLAFFLAILQATISFRQTASRELTRPLRSHYPHFVSVPAQQKKRFADTGLLRNFLVRFCCQSLSNFCSMVSKSDAAGSLKHIEINQLIDDFLFKYQSSAFADARRPARMEKQ